MSVLSFILPFYTLVPPSLIESPDTDLYVMIIHRHLHVKDLDLG